MPDKIQFTAGKHNDLPLGGNKATASAAVKNVFSPVTEKGDVPLRKACGRVEGAQEHGILLVSEKREHTPAFHREKNASAGGKFIDEIFEENVVRDDYTGHKLSEF